MELNNKDLNKLIIIALGLILAVLAFILIRPVLLSIIGGLLLAYFFLPVYKRVLRLVKRKNLASGIVTLLAIIIILVPLWFLLPIVLEQSFQVFTSFQNADIASLIKNVLPGASDQFLAQLTVTFNNFAGKVASGLLNTLVNFFLDLPILLLHAFLIGFVFYFALRDGEKLKEFILELSPLNKDHEKILITKFKNITDAILYGQVVIGIVQGITAGIGFLIFGIPNAIILTVLAVILSIIPVIGPGLIWIPIAVYLIVKGQTIAAILFLAYNIIIVSSIDNILRTYIISKRSEIPAIIIFVGMIAGLFIFGILGLILGPLILTYFLIFLKAYKDNTLDSLFKK
jgi:predicted PurR-regulated permease PerM